MKECNPLRSLHIFDSLGKQLMLENNENNTFTTSIGSIFSIFMYVSSIVLGFIFGSDLYLRQNPTIVKTDEILPYSRVGIDDFPIILSFRDDSGFFIPNILDYFEVSIFILSLDEDSNTLSYNIFNNSLTYCDSTKFSQVYSDLVYGFVGNNTDENFICANGNNSWYYQNDYVSSNSTEISIQFFKCDSTLRKCPDNLEAILSFLYVSIQYFDSIVGPNNFSNPITYQLKSVATSIGLGISKRQYFRIRKDVFISDNSWILDSKTDFEYFTIDSVYMDIQLDDGIYCLTLESPIIRVETMRRYIKIQQLFAIVGGIMNFFRIIVTLITMHYVRFKFLMHILQKATSSTTSSLKMDSILKKPQLISNILNPPEIKSNFQDNNVNAIKTYRIDKALFEDESIVIKKKNKDETVINSECNILSIKTDKKDDEDNNKTKIIINDISNRINDFDNYFRLLRTFVNKEDRHHYALIYSISMNIISFDMYLKKSSKDYLDRYLTEEINDSLKA